MPYSILSNSPTPGSIAWSDLNVVYDGVTYAIPDGDTQQTYVYWTLANPNVLQTSNSQPTLGIDDAIIFLNRNGTAINLVSSTLTDGAAIAVNTITADQIAANAITAAKIQAGAITADKLFIGSIGSALNDDPNTEDATAWMRIGGSASNNAEFVKITDAYFGEGVIQNVMPSIGGSLYGSIRRIPVDRGRTYRVRSFARSIESANGTFTLGIILYDAAGNPIAGDGSEWFYAVQNVAANTMWSAYSGTFGFGSAKPIPLAAKTMIPFVRLNRGASTGKWQAQDIRVEEVLPATLIQDGAITTNKIAVNAITADRIAANTIDASHIVASSITGDRIAANTITADRIDARGLSIKDAAGNTVFSAGTGLDYSLVTGPTAPEAGATRNINRGDWTSGNVLYQPGDETTFEGSSYTCTLLHYSSPTVKPPEFPTSFNEYWQLRAARGNAGTSSITVILSNEAHTFPADSAGNVTSYSGSGTDITVYEGATPLQFKTSLTGPNQFTVSRVGSGITPGAVSASTSGVSRAIVSQHSAMVDFVAKVDYQITARNSLGVDAVFTKTQSFSKALAGANGADGTGSGGSASGITMTASNQSFIFIDNVANPSTQPEVLFSITRRGVGDSTSNPISFSTTPSVTLTGTGDTRTLTLANFGTENKSVKVRAQVVFEGQTYFDEITIFRLDGSTAPQLGVNIINQDGLLVTEQDVLNANTMAIPRVLYDLNGANPFTVANPATLNATSVTFAHGLITSPTITSFSGSDSTRLLMRIRRVSGTGWYGRVSFSTTALSGSDFTNRYKQIPNVLTSEFKIIELNMGALNAGGTAWTAGQVNRLYFNFSDTSGDKFEIDWIVVLQAKPASFESLGGGALGMVNQITSGNISTYIANAAIGSAQVGTLTANNIAAGAITAAKINVASLSSIAADVGTLTAGVLKSPDNKFIIDLNNKQIYIEG